MPSNIHTAVITVVTIRNNYGDIIISYFITYFPMFSFPRVKPHKLDTYANFICHKLLLI